MIHEALQSILRCGELAADLAGPVRFTGTDPVFPTAYRIGTAGAAALGAVGVAMNHLRGRGAHGHAGLEIDVRAAAASLRSSTHYVKLDGRDRPGMDALTGFYPTAGGRWNYFHCNMPAHRRALARVLDVPAEPDAVAKAALRWQAFDLEEAVNSAGGCAPTVRTPEEWKALPNTTSLAGEPLVEIRKLADSAPMALHGSGRPLAGIRALDLTRVLAGPTCARLLAEYGADVIKITCDRHPDSPHLEWDTGYGKRTTVLDIATPDGRARFEPLLRDCDVFVQAYRPGAMTALGFSPERVSALRPGIVYVSLSAYGFTGAWRERRGFDTVVQSASGMAHISGRGGRPRFLPVSSLDYLAGYLLTFGTLVALQRRAERGGSYCVNVSLARVSEWMTAMGLFDAPAVDATPADLRTDELAHWLIDVPTPLGRLTRLRPVIRFGNRALDELPVWRASADIGAAWVG